MRKNKKYRLDLTGLVTKHGTVVDSDKPSYWNILCAHCGEIHEQNCREIKNEKLTIKCSTYRPHNYSGLEHRDGIIRRQYGITQEGYLVMSEAQGNVCAICKRPDEVEGRALAIDHCHTTGNIRGLLCGPCNRALGLFQDRIERLSSAIDYLQKDNYV